MREKAHPPLTPRHTGPVSPERGRWLLNTFAMRLAADDLRARFDAPDALGIGLEEELFLLDHETLDLLPRAREVAERTSGDPRFKLELPASQLEIITPPCADVETAVAALRTA